MSDYDLDLLMRPATELGRMLASGELTSETLVGQTLAAIDARDGEINSYISIQRETALAQARESDARRKAGAPLSAIDGLTVAVKDNIDVAGAVTTGGLAIPQSAEPAAEDAFCVAKLRAAGAVLIGKLNMHEAALGATNDNPHHGKCYNPTRAGYTPGGSSGGSGAAVAAGLCAFSLGTDTMGSVRIPAAYCGVSGVKPSRGAVSIDGTVILSRKLDNIGPLARTSEDLGLILPIMAGFDPSCAESREMVLPALDQPATAYRFGVATALEGIGVEGEILAAFYGVCETLGGHKIKLEPKPFAGFDLGATRRAGLLICELDMALFHQQNLADHPEYFSPELRKMIDWGLSRSALDLCKADWKLDAAVVKVNELLAGVDFLLLPTAPQCAFPFTDPTPVGQADLTSIANMAGNPAISIPMGLNSDGLPMGLQILGRQGSDLQLIEVAQQFAALLN